MNRKSLIRAASVSLLLAPALAAAKESPITDSLPPVFQAVADCRQLTADAERLACYDRNVATMVSARENHDLVVADRATLRETKKGLFGFTLPKLKLFGNTEGEDIQEIETTISLVRPAKDGYAVFTLADGARWKQTDGGKSWAKPGDKIRIKRGALGSFMANVGNAAAVRVMRLAN
ncbi:hypothetical protein OLX02_05210 [Novosphingobium sp. KCTC 2891]|uniref:hypothetical protein n=1 Tax=Novosphingobium sp. KCTC 2891 TaxID=2989730 RepID=UPI002223ABB0|nr:hypothetical protein [Novosphingobium sp. KCTC 2891]MCW1382212.1 hypothetical protein [Novosphingobium sp. KCTC 2891]